MANGLQDVPGYYQQLAEQLNKLPGAEAVSYSQNTPAFGFEFAESLSSPEASARALTDSVGPGFFKRLRIPLSQGREFNWQDSATAPPVAIISRRLALHLFHDDPIGRKVAFGEQGCGKEVTIVGVVPGRRPLEAPDTASDGNLSAAHAGLY